MRTVPDFRYTNVQVWKGLRDWVKVNAGPLQVRCIRQRRTEMGKIVVLIPAYKPEEKMLKLLESLSGFSGGSAAGDRRGKEENTGINTEKAVSAETAEIDGIVIVDDGGQEEYRALFDAAEAMGCRVVHHEVNRGKGAAIRTGIREAMECFGADVHVVTADADGQHLPKDILRVARAVLDHNARGDAAGPVLVLGVRDFSGRDVPARSRLGNRITAAFFRLSTGTSCGDTQTGLRGIPAALLPLSLETEGDRYEYEMNFLTEAVRKADLVQIPIETVYEEGNRSSGLGTVSHSPQAVWSVRFHIRNSRCSSGCSRGGGDCGQGSRCRCGSCQDRFGTVQFRAEPPLELSEQGAGRQRGCPLSAPVRRKYALQRRDRIRILLCGDARGFGKGRCRRDAFHSQLSCSETMGIRFTPETVVIL